MIYLYAHRGNNNHSYKENSVEAILKSLQTPYISGVELDIRFTNDKKIVVSHNPSILIHNSYYFISQLSLKEIEKHSNLVSLPYLLEKIKSDKKIIIEVKYEEKIDPKDIDILYALLHKYSNLHIYLCSFNRTFLKQFKKKYKEIPCGIFITHVLNLLYIPKFDFYLIQHFMHRYFLTKKLSFFWTMNYKFELEKLKQDKQKDFHIITDCAYQLKDS